MRPITQRVKDKVLARPPVCQRYTVFKDHVCHGRITLEHCWVYGGKQIDEPWAIIKLCAWAHDVDQFQDGGNLDKGKNQLVSLMQATDEDLAKYPRVDWNQKKKFLTTKYEGTNRV